MSCPRCQLPIAEVVLDRECPFCSAVFSRVDGARRHAKRCPRRGDRALRPAKRGRKALSCDRCSQVKVHCNARFQVPCDGCAARKLDCTFIRLCLCNDNVPDPAAQGYSDLVPPRHSRDGVVPLSFLLNATDDRQDFVTETAVGKEPDGALLGPICATPPQARVHNEPLFDYIDPTLLLTGGPTLQPLHQEMDEEHESTLLTSRSCGDLATRIAMLEAELATYTQFDANAFHRTFSVPNIYELVMTFCRKRHYRYPIIHWPTFVLEDTPLPLLLVVSLTGASYSYRDVGRGRQHFDVRYDREHVGSEFDREHVVVEHDREHVDNARDLYAVADAFVFEQLSACLSRGTDKMEAIQLCQAALLMYGLDTLPAGDAAMQRTAVTQRLPAIVSAIRGLQLIGTQHTVGETWQCFVQRESIIRLMSWTFCADCLATLTCNSPPLFSLLEMTGDLPCNPDLWDADCAIKFELLSLSRSQPPSHNLKDLMSCLLDHEAHPDINLTDLPLSHLHIIICACQPLIFNLHVALALVSQSPKILQSFGRWRHLWDGAMRNIPDDDRNLLGVARYVPAIECLSRRIIEVAVSPEASSSKYLQRIPSYGTKEIHEFIKSFVAKA